MSASAEKLSVQVAPPFEGQALVGGVANERMAETERTGDVGIHLDELTQPVPCVRRCGHGLVAFEHVGDQRA